MCETSWRNRKAREKGNGQKDVSKVGGEYYKTKKNELMTIQCRPVARLVILCQLKELTIRND